MYSFPQKKSYGPHTNPLPKVRQPQAISPGRNRKENSGIFDHDQHVSDTAIDEATEAEEDDDWDFVEAIDGEDRNGTEGPSPFARGFAVCRKASILGMA